MGREYDQDWYCSGTIFYDFGSTKIHITHQFSLDTATTLKSKYEFEHQAGLAGITVGGYCADNRIFNSKEFLEDCQIQEQTMDLCGVGAHPQNGVAEHAIQIIVSRTRTIIIDMLIH